MSKRQLNAFFARVGARSLVSMKTGADVDMKREGDLLVFECPSDGWRFAFEPITEEDESKSTPRGRRKKTDEAETEPEGD